MVLWEEFLPVMWKESVCTYEWSIGLERALGRLSKGPTVSDVRSGSAFANFLLQVADPDTNLDGAVDGIAYYFDEQVESAQSSIFFEQTLPRMAQIVLHLPVLLLQQIEQSNKFAEKRSEELADSRECDSVGVSLPLALQILHPQHPGIIFITQELAASILSCAFLCLFPVSKRDEYYLPGINMHTLFGSIRDRPSQIHKLHCLVNYFNRVCKSMPQGMISYERKYLANYKTLKSAFWSDNHKSLCSLEILDQGMIEDVGCEYVQVDFANKFLGGGVLRTGCVQEEIRFTLSPELIVGMLFLPVMTDNETIEITGTERFSNYAGYAWKFHFAGDFIDSTPRDAWGRRHTKIVAMDAKPRPGHSQFQENIMLREMCKAYCGFLPTEKEDLNVLQSGCERTLYRGIATGNWGCGAFGGNLPIKSMLQWVAASEAGWPTVKYYTFRDQRAERLCEAMRYIVEKNYDISQLWGILLKYGELRLSKNVECDFFTWLLRTTI